MTVFYFCWLILTIFNPVQVLSVDIQELGNYLSSKEIDSTELCGSKLCLLDSSRLVDSATKQWSVDACQDFREFSMGNFIKYRALHDRYDRIGFLFDVLSLHSERQRKILAEPIQQNEPKIFKIIKNFFQKCVDSGNA